jgi:hypothetical protein
MHGKLMEEGSHERQAKMPRQSRRCVSPLAGESGRSKGKKSGHGRGRLGHENEYKNCMMTIAVGRACWIELDTK